MKQNLCSLSLIILLVFGCGNNNFDRYKDVIHETLQDPKSRKFKNSSNDANDLSGCQIDYELGRWRQDIRRGIWNGAWKRSGSSINKNRIISKGNIYLNPKGGKMNSIQASESPDTHPIYIGPWQDTILTKPTPFTLSFTNLFRSDEQKDRKLRALDYRRTLKIRFFAYQELDSGEIKYSYESMNNKNKKIKSKPFSLSKKSKIAPNRFDLCVVKWTAKFGYNAIAEVKSKNSFSKDYLVPTGKIIEAK